MTKGKALLETRRLVGPSGHVRFGGGKARVGKFNHRGFVQYRVGETFDEALEKLREMKKGKA
jgi:hypothetical protein